MGCFKLTYEDDFSVNRFFENKGIAKKFSAPSLYEKENHLGNVHAVITDRKLQVEDTNNLGAVNYYTANVTSYTDYYPFGMEIGSRTYHSADLYRYSFQGQEGDPEYYCIMCFHNIKSFKFGNELFG